MKNTGLLLILLLFTSGLKSQDTLTIREVFDFEVGDEFHIWDLLSTCPLSLWGNDYDQYRHRRETILERYLSPEDDTLFYIVNVEGFEKKINPSWNGEDPVIYYFKAFDHNDTVFYTDFDSTVLFFLEDFLESVFQAYYFDLYTGGSYRNILPELNSFNVERNTIEYGDGLSGGIIEFGTGIGIIYEILTFESEPCIAFENELFYVKKKDFTCGEPSTFHVNTKDSKVNEKFLAFPNPTTGILYLKFEQAKLNKVELYNSNLQLKADYILKSDPGIIDISNLTPGIYFLKLNTGDLDQWIRVIKK